MSAPAADARACAVANDPRPVTPGRRRPDPLLRIEGLVKRFPIAGSRKVVQAINGVSLEIGVGETVGLVGESGSGKTTVGRCILGLTDATEGRIIFRGRHLGDRRVARNELRGKVQLVFQEPGESLDPRLRIGQSIEEPLLPLRVERAGRRDRVRRAIERVGLPTDSLELFPAELSAGHQQRVGIARAMVTDPDLVVLDEPTSALDPTARADIIDLLQRIQTDSGTSYLFISHDLSTVRFISHRVAVMYLGMIVEQGDTAELFARPRHPYSIGLLSSVLLPHPHLTVTAGLSLAGEIPSPIDLPRGCFLASRCPFVIDRCRARMPPEEAIAPGHLLHCFRHADTASAGRGSDAFTLFQREAVRILGRQPSPSG